MLQKFPMHAYIPVANLARARQFYEQKLGFKPGREVAGGVTYQFGEGTACFMYPSPNAGTSKASQAFWQVDDVEREVADLKARGSTAVIDDEFARDIEEGIKAHREPWNPPSWD